MSLINLFISVALNDVMPKEPEKCILTYFRFKINQHSLSLMKINGLTVKGQKNEN